MRESVSYQRSRHAYVELRKILAAGGQTLTYKDFGARLGIHARVVGAPLIVVQNHCRIRGLPTNTVLVVLKATGLPGAGCDASTPEDFDRTLKEVKATNWPEVAWW